MADVLAPSGTGDPFLALHPRIGTLSRNWWAVAVRGALALAFGVVAIAEPGLAFASLAFLFALYLMADGFAATIAACRAASHHHRWGDLALEGVAGILAGCVVLALPGIALLLFVTLMAVWAVFSGAMMLAGAVRLRGARGRLPLLAGGVVSVAWGSLLFLHPAAGAAILALWLGAYAIVFGIAMSVSAYRLRCQYRDG